MKFLLLNGHGISMKVDRAHLHITDGRFSTEEEPAKYVFHPQRIDIDSIVIYGRSGNLSLEAIRWLVKHNVQVSILDWDGTMLTTMLPPESVQVKTKFVQYHAFDDKKLRLKLAKKFIESKFDRTQIVLDYLHQRYPGVDPVIPYEPKSLKDAKLIREVMGVEGAVAQHYWKQFAKVIPEKYEFESRTGRYHTRPSGAGDQVNCMLNYGYALLEAECLRVINSVGLDAHVGFLHEMQSGKNSLAYDMQELFRFLVDLAVINLVERDAMTAKDFIRTESYALRLRPTGARKMTEEVNAWFNKTVEYQGKELMWSYVMVLKGRELAQYLTGKKQSVSFMKPEYQVDRVDTDEIRRKILSISYADWKKLGFSKGSLHYMKKNAESEKPFSLNQHVVERLMVWDQLKETLSV
ncbi:CRISPR-associated endonuclease Cas1 [Methanogenium sp. S4BF]|uniref:CRISPR-associated endonuclease Cas1 n=1 Tax=Methanogenium sp. S4BF TaxID=1789226 RepID=UPI0024169930|nr:CRISPR-associated endonuclease Cas1 [Methanogenium sp. S4BF]WFN35245.1 CRISPR-associated endonuclease Cas1 [Methanogenium sp. S4BF]